MKIVIKHEISGRIRFSMPQRRFSYEEADRLQYYLLSLNGVENATVYERSADADTIVFDKTGTLTMATPKVVDVVTFSGNDKDEMLRLAACLEEHYPHSIANAVVAERGLEHNEMHSKVEYVVAHGIASDIEGQKVVIGSWHFVMEDEKCIIPDGEQDKLDGISKQYSRLFLAIGGKLSKELI